jgi:hypothetical protein
MTHGAVMAALIVEDDEHNNHLERKKSFSYTGARSFPVHVRRSLPLHARRRFCVVILKFNSYPSIEAQIEQQHELPPPLHGAMAPLHSAGTDCCSTLELQ